eukprot:551708-Karenia_brevis.AAC.1
MSGVEDQAADAIEVRTADVTMGDARGATMIATEKIPVVDQAARSGASQADMCQQHSTVVTPSNQDMVADSKAR